MKNKTDKPTYKAGDYICPKCKFVVTVYISMTAPPACWNHSIGTIIQMEVRK